MMQCGKDPAQSFKNMAEDLDIFKPTSIPADSVNTSIVSSGDTAIKRRLSFSSEREISQEEPNMTGSVETVQNVSDDSGSCRLSPQTVNTRFKTKHGLNVIIVNSSEDKENTAVPPTNITQDKIQEEDISGRGNVESSTVTGSNQHTTSEDRDAEVVRRAQEEGCVNVVFPGTVTQEGCCRFVSEILKCILYQRQQLPMTYDQLVYSQKKQQTSVQDKDAVSRRPVQSADMDWRKCQQTLQELEEVLQHLEVLFSLSKVPRVLLLIGGTLIVPKELYEINMEDLVLAGGDQCLRVSSCLRQLFRTLFVADLLSDTRPVRLMPTTVLVMAHRDCGVGWFRPKLQFKVPTRVKKQIIALSTDPSICKEPRAEGSDWEDYVWFQAPMNIKGFSN
ncbi:MAD2L1-binding protein [Acanthochromis polyacanthus]|uniref:MAD2L1-binding protein n=1 Tax=Acanthochromis polyacanthus TaxID=80966 RepID=UPI00223441EC|nr:MAD2L1-binding protein [Acanthochromis polyacanthus]